MNSIVFTKEEKKQIKDCLDVVLDDIREIWKLSNGSAMQVFLEMKILEEEYCFLGINNKCIFLDDLSDNSSVILEKIKNKKVERTNDFEIAFQFLQNYEKIREEIFNYMYREAILNFDEKDRFEERNKPKEAIIEIQIPPYKNQQIIEVQKVNGRNVGTIDFGDKAIKLITDNEIILVNRIEEAKKLEKKI